MKHFVLLSLLTVTALSYPVAVHATSNTSTSTSTSTNAANSSPSTGPEAARIARREANRDFNNAQRDFKQATKQYRRTQRNVVNTPAPQGSVTINGITTIPNNNNNVYDARVKPPAQRLGNSVNANTSSTISVNDDLNEEALDRYERAEKRYERAEDQYDDRIRRLDRYERRYDRNLSSRISINND